MTWASSPFQISAYPEKFINISKGNRKKCQYQGPYVHVFRTKVDQHHGENLKQVDPELLTYEYVASERVLLPSIITYTTFTKIIPLHLGAPGGHYSMQRSSSG